MSLRTINIKRTDSVYFIKQGSLQHACSFCDVCEAIFFCFLDPEWASCNIGVFICLDCSGVHRGFGTDVSRVKSIRLDNWDGDQVQVINEFSKFSS